MKRLVVSGVGLQGDGYPNAKTTISLLAADKTLEVVDVARWLPAEMHLWRIARGPLLARLMYAIRFAYLGFVAAIRVFQNAKRSDLVYVPYPAPLLMGWLSLLPKRLRPRCIVDGYISIWDSMFRDRSGSDGRGFVSRMVKRFEGRALGAADLVLVDTEANEYQTVADFAISKRRVRSLPLAIEEERFLAIKPKESDRRRVRILFVGTMIPLHGVPVILDAMKHLRNDERLEFRLVGDGQLSEKVAEVLRDLPVERVSWFRGWKNLDEVAEEIANADICLGVFGGDSGKASRVLPIKLYMYLASGRAVISQAAYSTPHGIPELPVAFPAHGGADALVKKIVELVEHPAFLQELGAASRNYYLDWLCNERVVGAWAEILQS